MLVGVRLEEKPAMYLKTVSLGLRKCSLRETEFSIYLVG